MVSSTKLVSLSGVSELSRSPGSAPHSLVGDHGQRLLDRHDVSATTTTAMTRRPLAHQAAPSAFGRDLSGHQPVSTGTGQGIQALAGLWRLQRRTRCPLTCVQPI